MQSFGCLLRSSRAWCCGHRSLATRACRESDSRFDIKRASIYGNVLLRSVDWPEARGFSSRYRLRHEVLLFPPKKDYKKSDRASVTLCPYDFPELTCAALHEVADLKCLTTTAHLRQPSLCCSCSMSCGIVLDETPAPLAGYSSICPKPASNSVLPHRRHVRAKPA